MLETINKLIAERARAVEAPAVRGKLECGRRQEPERDVGRREHERRASHERKAE